jgi:hypothetical protein
MRKIGYHFQGQSGQESSFVRPPRGYPRFHVYLREEEDDDLILNLHLDQKRPSYKGTTAHSGEYEGKIVENEVERIKQIFKKEYQETI